MRDDAKSGRPDDLQVCSWCGRRPAPVTEERSPVCGRCVRLLMDAGLTHEEIFGPPGARPAGGETGEKK